MALKRKANIIITGTPGTGKTSHATLLAEQVPELSVVDINKVAKENNCISGYDEARKSDIVDENLLVEAIEDDLEKGNKILDWHVCDAFPEHLIDLVVVLRTDNTTLYDRLKSRGYSDAKIEENIDAEIMEVILNDARENFSEEMIVQLDSTKIENVQDNVDRIAAWYEQWNKDHPEGEDLINLPVDSSDSD